MNKEVLAALNSADAKRSLLELNSEASPSSPAQLGELLATEINRWSNVIAKAKTPTQQRQPIDLVP